jgi:Ca-activated chloride channel family protein
MDLSWYREFSRPEWVLVIVFGLFSLVFIAKNIFIAATLKVNTAAIVIKLLIRSLYLSLIILALMGPLFGEVQKEVKAVGRDIFICVDLSESMNANDISPSRLSRLKYALKTLSSSLKGDRIGLIIFSNEAFMQCPLTFDQGALQLFIETMNTDLLPSSGTDFGPPLDLAMKKLMNEDGGTPGKKLARLILLISDGEDFGEETEQAMEKVKENGIRLLTLGIGTQAGGKIPSSQGGYLNDDEGNVVISKLEDASLRKLADDTGGGYFEITDDKSELDALINSIKKFEGTVRESRTFDVSTNKYMYPLLLAMVLILFDLLIKIRIIRL